MSAHSTDGSPCRACSPITPIAYCYSCETTYFTNNAPNQQGPDPIYGAYGLRKHAGHDVRPVEVSR